MTGMDSAERTDWSPPPLLPHPLKKEHAAKRYIKYAHTYTMTQASKWKTSRHSLEMLSHRVTFKSQSCGNFLQHITHNTMQNRTLLKQRKRSKIQTGGNAHISPWTPVKPSQGGMHIVKGAENLINIHTRKYFCNFARCNIKCRATDVQGQSHRSETCILSTIFSTSLTGVTFARHFARGVGAYECALCWCIKRCLITTECDVQASYDRKRSTTLVTVFICMKNIDWRWRGQTPLGDWGWHLQTLTLWERLALPKQGYMRHTWERSALHTDT